ncbi:hypothetical protein [Deminuibacter soli]|uniref:Uncharacterized protein n=1 Tax=Deminuibacter soli TaxID=2291815 RepID=A0A3E1NFR0_9BACT|nr:hypothetical protein [Deminuibacter soli]RFM26803.1 hypothetical protein DXN05_17595 [Deminuibacter soli]
MYKIQLFHEKSAELLQQRANEWLTSHKEIAITQSNTTQSGTGIDASFSLYLLYTTTEAQAEELKELAAEVKPQDSVEATTINPDILTPSS